MTLLKIPELSLVLLIGPSGSGKSTFARRHFRPTEVLSSDAFRALIADDEADQTATADAFGLLHALAARRMRRGRKVIVDATNLDHRGREPLLALAKEHYYQVVGIVFNLSEQECLAQNVQRTDRLVPEAVIGHHCDQLRRTLEHLRHERFRSLHVLSSPTEIEAVQIAWQPMPPDRRGDSGPFDLIGDVHGCFTELCLLLERLGYALEPGPDGTAQAMARHAAGRRLIFLGDLVDRGPQAPACLRLAMNMVRAGTALMVPGNHEEKLWRFLDGRSVNDHHGFAATRAQLAVESAEFKAEVAAFIDQLPSHLVLDGGRLVAAHAGMKEAMHGRDTGTVQAFALYGETTGETDANGLPVRYNWAGDYRGKATVVYGHTPIPSAEWVHGTICIDTGCVYGGALTALRYPEREVVGVPAQRVYFTPERPLALAKA